MKKIRLLFVCLGNICRSPLAQGVFDHVSAQAGQGDRFETDSAGTASWHVGKPPDPRGIAAAARRGIDISGQRARRLSREDFEEFDLILVMDRANHENALALAPAPHASKVQLFLDGVADAPLREVPDPYYGGDDGFEEVLDLIEAGSKALIQRLVQG